MLSGISGFIGVTLEQFSFNDFLTSAAWLDWILLFLVVLGIIYGASKGLARELVKSLEILFIIFAVLQLHSKVASFLTSYAKIGGGMAEPAGYLATLSVVFLSVVFVDSFLIKLMHVTMVAPLRIPGGMFFGFCNTVMIIGLFAFGLNLWPFYQVKSIFEPGNSYVAYHSVSIIPKVNDVILAPVNQFKPAAKKTAEATDV